MKALIPTKVLPPFRSASHSFEPHKRRQDSRATFSNLLSGMTSAELYPLEYACVMGYRFEFDPVNKILLLRVEGRLTEELFVEFYRAGQKHWVATGSKMSILDYTLVTKVAVSTEFLRRFAHREPAGDVSKRPRVIVAPSPLLFGLARMFQMMGEGARPLLQTVHTLDEAFAALGVQAPRFHPLE